MNLITVLVSRHGTVQGHFYSALKIVLYVLQDSSKCLCWTVLLNVYTSERTT